MIEGGGMHDKGHSLKDYIILTQRYGLAPHEKSLLGKGTVDLMQGKS